MFEELHEVHVGRVEWKGVIKRTRAWVKLKTLKEEEEGERDAGREEVKSKGTETGNFERKE